MRSVREWLADHWGLEVSDFQAVGPVWRATTERGDFCVKFAKHGTAKMLFHHYAIESLFQNKFSDTPRLLPNRLGEPFSELPEGLLTVSPWVGRPLDETSPSEWRRAAAALGRFHRASIDLRLPAGVKPITFGGKWSKRLPERVIEWKRAMRAFHLPRNEFEQRVRDEGAPIFVAAQAASEALQRSAYDEMVDALQETPALVHGNVKGENFAVEEDGRVSLIDFDSFRVDVPVQDLADLLTHVVHAFGGSQTAAQDVLLAYHEQHPLSPAEANVLIALMSYPYAVHKVVHKYVEDGRSVEKSLRKWKRAVEEWQTLEPFLEKWASWLTSRVE
ncbi:MAG TPA: phosphotransferase [Bacilli bacterium]|nr:phosphotransferase [Bacilli bacterium]